LLKSNLPKSHSPYYLMSELASNAKARGDKMEALRWYEEAYDHSEGPATRLQWGASYVAALIELTPRDDRRIEHAAARVLSEAAQQPDAFYERSARSLQRLGGRLQAWSVATSHPGVLGRLQRQLDGVCRALGPQDPKRDACAALFKPQPKRVA
jgi:hypothetical protein